MTLRNDDAGVKGPGFFARWWRRVLCWLGKHEFEDRLKLMVIRSTGEEPKRRRILIQCHQCKHCGYLDKVTPMGSIRHR